MSSHGVRTTVLDSCPFSNIRTGELIRNADVWVPPQVCWISISGCGPWELALVTGFLKGGIPGCSRLMINTARRTLPHSRGVQGCEWWSLIVFYLVCRGQQEIPHQPPNSLTLEWGRKATQGGEQSSKSQLCPAYCPGLPWAFEGPGHRANLEPRRQSTAQAGAKEDIKWKKRPRQVAQLARRSGLMEEEMEEVRDEVCLDIALDVVNISLCFVTDQNLDWHDQSACKQP